MDETLDRREALRAIRAYRNGDHGIPYSALQRFAAPIFDLYGMDDRDASETASAQELIDHLSVMETARLFWCYFGCGAQQDEILSSRLKTLLVGTSPTLEQEAVFAALVEQLYENWSSTPLSVQRVNGKPHTTTSLLQLLAELEAGCTSGEDADVEPTTGAVDSPEALAIFASPLLEDPSVADDPDRLSELMARARDYWRLAQLDGSDFESEQEVVAERYASGPEDRRMILAEASFMVARFHMLFPHWTGSGGDA
jgi:hypothetical protein